jgi:hypothetical protein
MAPEPTGRLVAWLAPQQIADLTEFGQDPGNIVS